MAAGRSPAEPACVHQLGWHGGKALLFSHRNAARETWKNLLPHFSCCCGAGFPAHPGLGGRFLTCEQCLGWVSRGQSEARGGCVAAADLPDRGSWPGPVPAAVTTQLTRWLFLLTDSFGAGWVRNGTSLVVFAGAIAHV